MIQGIRKIEACAGDMKRKWNTIKKPLYSASSLPSSTPEEDKSRVQTTSFFHNVLTKVKVAISSKFNSFLPDPLRGDKLFTGERLCNLPPVTEEKIQWLLSQMLNESSFSDFILTSLLKECCAAFAAIITRLANRGSFVVYSEDLPALIER